MKKAHVLALIGMLIIAIASCQAPISPGVSIGIASTATATNTELSLSGESAATTQEPVLSELLEAPPTLEGMPMRKFTYVSSYGTLTLGPGGNFMIETVEGLSEPGLVHQEQKAPYQDGTTYIDTLFQVRDIVITGAITYSDFTNINAQKDVLLRHLNAKNAQGTLTYSATGISDRVITATPHVVFSNKHYRDGFQRFQITFRANDPYWKATAGSTVSLPTVVNGSAITISSDGQNPCIIEQSNGTLRIVYKNNSNTYLVQKTSTDSGATWSVESTINAANTNLPWIIQLANNSFLVTYQNASGYLSKRTSTDGITWSAESNIIAAATSENSTLLLASGNILLVYRRGSDGAVCKRLSTDSGATWSTEAVITTGASLTGVPTLFQMPDGTIQVTYSNGNIAYKTSSDFGSTWSSETVKSITSSNVFSRLSANGIYYLTYIDGATAFINTISSYDNINYTSPSVLTNVACTEFGYILISNGSTFFAYKESSSSAIKGVSRKVTPVASTVTGHVPAPISVTFNGPSTNPRIINNGTLEYIRINKTLATGDSFVINTAFGQKTVSMISGGIAVNGMAYLDLGSTFFQLAVGANTVYFEDDAVASSATATMTWTERYIGV